MYSTLIDNPLFRGIAPETLSSALAEVNFRMRSYRKGEILARQGDVCNRLVILAKGSVRGEMIDYSGRLVKVEDIAAPRALADRKSTRLNSSHANISYAVFCLKKK